MTNTIEEIDLQIKELQEQKLRLLEKQKAEEEKVFFDVTEIITAADQRLHKVLIDAGVEECEVLSISTNQMRLLEDHEMIRLNVKTSEDKVILSRIFRVSNIYKIIDEIISNAIAIEEIVCRFKSLLKEDNSLFLDSMILVTESERVDVYLSFLDNGIFDVEVNESLNLDDSEEVHIRFGKDANVSISVRGLEMSADFNYKKENVTVSELADVLIEIDKYYKDFSIRSY